MLELSTDRIQRRMTARKLAESDIAPRAADVDRTEEYPWANVEALREAGFMGMTIPQRYGGGGLTYMDAVLVIEQMARACGVTARIVVEANMGAVGAIMAYGSEAQKTLAAELVLAGDKPAICITEPGAGSAATEMTTRADKSGDRYILNSNTGSRAEAFRRSSPACTRTESNRGAACKTLIDSERRKNTQASSDVGARQLARF